MRTLILLFASLSIISCSRFTKDSQKPKAVLLTHKESVDTLRSKTDSLKAVSFELLSKQEAGRLLDEMDLSLSLYNKDSLDQYFNRFDGFFGTDHYRIEIYWNKVEKDSLKNNVYHLSGKTRFKDNINNYTGTLTIDSVFRFKDPNIDERYYDEGAIMNENLYEFTGEIVMNEDSSQKGSGFFKGKIALDIARQVKGNAFLWFFTPETKALGSGFKVDGHWTSYHSGTRKPFVFSKDLFIFANNILSDFSYGEREVEINPKYRNLGWQDFWDMKEWWLDEPAAIQ